MVTPYKAVKIPQAVKKQLDKIVEKGPIDTDLQFDIFEAGVSVDKALTRAYELKRGLL